jgi:hypothetical protein
MKADWKLNCLVGTVSLAAVLAASITLVAKTQTFTGTVGDAVCGAKHVMEGDDVSCLRRCVQKGSKYDLVVDDKVYVLEPKDESTIDDLDKLAGQQAKVRGEEVGGTIEVESITAAK